MSDKAPPEALLPTHPVVELALRALASEAGGAYTFAAPGVEAIRQALATVDGADLRLAVEHLMRFAHHLDTQRSSPKAARALTALLEEQLPRLAAMGRAAAVAQTGAARANSLGWDTGASDPKPKR